MLGRHDQVDVAKNAAARLIEQKTSKDLVTGDETGLLPQAVAGRRRNPADDDVADLPFGMARYDMDDFGSTHGGEPGRTPA